MIDDIILYHILPYLDIHDLLINVRCSDKNFKRLVDKHLGKIPRPYFERFNTYPRVYINTVGDVYNLQKQYVTLVKLTAGNPYIIPHRQCVVYNFKIPEKAQPIIEANGSRLNIPIRDMVIIISCIPYTNLTITVKEDTEIEYTGVYLDYSIFRKLSINMFTDCYTGFTYGVGMICNGKKNITRESIRQTNDLFKI